MIIITALICILVFNSYRYYELKEHSYMYTIKQYIKYQNYSTIKLNFVVLLGVLCCYLYQSLF